MNRKYHLISSALWLWLMAATVAYLFQFWDVLGPILNVIGLK